MRYQSRNSTASEVCKGPGGVRDKVQVINSLKIGPAIMQAAICGYDCDSGLEMYITDAQGYCKAKLHTGVCMCTGRIKLCQAILNNARSTAPPITAMHLYQQHKAPNSDSINNVLYKLRHLPFSFVKVRVIKCMHRAYVWLRRWCKALTLHGKWFQNCRSISSRHI